MIFIRLKLVSSESYVTFHDILKFKKKNKFVKGFSLD